MYPLFTLQACEGRLMKVWSTRASVYGEFQLTTILDHNLIRTAVIPNLQCNFEALTEVGQGVGPLISFLLIKSNRGHCHDGLSSGRVCRRERAMEDKHAPSERPEGSAFKRLGREMVKMPSRGTRTHPLGFSPQSKIRCLI